MRILFLSRWFPYPANNGSKLRIYNLLKGLGRLHQVTLISFYEPPETPASLADLHACCQEVIPVRWKPFNPSSFRAMMGFFSIKPRVVVDTFVKEMQSVIEKTLTTKAYDLVIASQFDMAMYSRSFGSLPAIFEEAEVGVLYDQYARAPTPMARFRFGLTWLKHRRYLAKILLNFKACTVVSDLERRLLKELVKVEQPVEVLPNFIDVPSYDHVQETPRENTLIFTGSLRYPPNYEAMTWFVREVYPLIQAQVPEVNLTITGDHADQPLPPARNVVLTGLVEDVRTLMARSWVGLVPIHTGGGTRLKILEAMALRLPVVSTPKGVEGLDAQDGHHLLVADSPGSFAKAVLRLLRERDLRQNLIGNAYQLVRERYDQSVVIPRFLHLVTKVAQGS